MLLLGWISLMIYQISNRSQPAGKYKNEWILLVAVIFFTLNILKR